MIGGDHPKTAVLFVCLGNICRSPMAEGVLRAATHHAGLDIVVDSAGTAAYHVGEPPDYRAIAIAHNFGVEIGKQTARQIELKDYYRFHRIIAMDAANLEAIKARAPRDAMARFSLLLDAAPGREGTSVPDPYHGSGEDFEKVWGLIVEGIVGLVDELRAEAARAAP